MHQSKQTGNLRAIFRIIEKYETAGIPPGGNTIPEKMTNSLTLMTLFRMIISGRLQRLFPGLVSVILSGEPSEIAVLW
jgi:hypothetical protein